MKTYKLFAVLALILSLICASALAAAGVHVTKRDIALNNALDKNVTNILMLLQDGDVTDTILVASINSRTGRSVMTRIDSALPVDVQEVGTVPLGEVYALGDRKSRGFLALREINELLGLNAATYVTIDIEMLPELVDIVGALNMTLDAREAGALGLYSGGNPLDGETVLQYVRLSLDGDDPAHSRSYDAIMQLIYQGTHSSDLGGLVSLGTTLLDSMDTNLNPLNAATLVTAVHGGDDRRELFLSGEDAQTLRETFQREVYE